ncbi:MAG: (2Fe-2S)-binding protein [Chloroflexi bacterium]|nr:(2Fe-2S)-binding protein [Chloroflexota bacterium]
MVKLTINGKAVQAREGSTILDTARENNINIPTLCYNESLPAYGACRLCLVDITQHSGRQKMVASCLYPVEPGLQVQTSTEKLGRIRKTLIQLLLARCPDSEDIQEMARELGAVDTPFPLSEGKKKCILCGMCTRACEDVVGVSAISLVNRGVKRELATPFHKDFSPACIGCGSCAYVCPTKAISVQDIGGKRLVKWPHDQMDFKMKRCRSCGSYWAPEKQIEHIARKSGTSVKEYDLCPSCRE